MIQWNSPNSPPSVSRRPHSNRFKQMAVVMGWIAAFLMRQLLAAAEQPKDIESREKIIVQTLRSVRQKMEATRRKILDAENSALVIQKAIPLLQKGDPAQLDVIILEFGRLPRNQMLNAKQLGALRENLERSKKLLMALGRLAEMPSGRFPLADHPFRDDRLQPIRVIAERFAWRSAVQAQDREIAAALLSCRAVLNAGRSIGDEPLALPQLVRLAVQGMTLKAIERVLAQGTPSDSNLAAAQRSLEDEAKEPLLAQGVTGERTIATAWFAKVEEWNLDVLPARLNALILMEDTRFKPGELKALHDWYLRYTKGLQEVAERPPEQWLAGFATLDRLADQATPHQKEAVRVFRIFPPNFLRSQTRLRCGFVGIALERYRRANDRWPKTLAELCPKYLDKVPLDPYDGKSLRYSRLKDGVMVYSVGSDSKHNPAKRSAEKNGLHSEIDPGFQVWDVSKRRQEPQ